MKRKTARTPLTKFQLFIFYKHAVSDINIFTDDYYLRGVFRGQALWADSVSPQINTIALRDQFKPIGIGQNLVMNYN